MLKTIRRNFASGVMKYTNPYTLEIIGEEPFLSASEIKSKVNVAKEAFRENKERSLEERIGIAGDIVTYLKVHKEDMAV